MTSGNVVIVSAVRTPIGKLNGCLSSIPSYTLGSKVIAEVLKRAEVDKKDVSDVIMGQVLTAGQGMNPARHAALDAGLPTSVTACIINQVCGSGLRAVVMGYQAIKCGDASIVVAGGQESMSLAPHCVHMRSGVKMGNSALIDTMMEDGLIDCVYKCSMGITGENVSTKWNISKEEQDKFAVNSQMKCARAQKEGTFDKEIVPVAVKGRKGEVNLISIDEHPRSDTSIEGLSRLRPAFTKSDCVKDIKGTITAGNSAGINDGAAAVLLMSEQEAEKRSLTPLGHVVTWAHAGVDPLVMGTGPVPAIRKALAKAGWSVNDVDLFEINEAFAAQSLAVVNDLQIDKAKVNVNGGAIALGHPLGASGTRILVTLLYAMQKHNAKRGVAALCVGGGMGVALCVEQK